MTKEETLVWAIDATEKLNKILHDRSFNFAMQSIAFEASESMERLRLLLEYPDEAEFICTSAGQRVILTKEL